MNDRTGFFLIEPLNRLLIKRAVITKSTSRERVSALIKKLHPVCIENPFIRMGPKGDGGYLVPDDLDGIEACFSPGVSTESGFELDCIKRGMKVFMADKSVNAPALDVPSGQYSFLKKFVGCVNNEDYITMDEWVRSSPISSNTDLLLQMDIEGSEYAAIINTSTALMQRFRIIVLELHYLKDWWNQRFFDVVEQAIKKLLQSHVCVHIHPNNQFGVDKKTGLQIPRLIECTFVRKDRQVLDAYQTCFPHKLDVDNTGKKHIVLPPLFYRNQPNKD